MSKGRILVVDDEHSIRYTFALFLDESGYETVAVSELDEALRALSDGDVDLAFVDILLESASGIELLEEIKRRSPSTEVVIVTGVPSIETASEALRLGAFDYLVKPVRQEALLRVTDVALRHRAVDLAELLEHRREEIKVLAGEHERFHGVAPRVAVSERVTRAPRMAASSASPSTGLRKKASWGSQPRSGAIWNSGCSL